MEHASHQKVEAIHVNVWMAIRETSVILASMGFINMTEFVTRVDALQAVRGMNSVIQMASVTV